MLDKTLRTKIVLKNTYNIKNGYELIEKIKLIMVNNTTKIVSFDITNMYPNIPINDTIEIIKKHLVRIRESNNNINNIITLLRNSCNQNFHI